MDNTIDGYIAIAYAIVIQAIQDYGDTYKKRLKRPQDGTLKSRMDEIVRFFKSDWFYDLSGVDGEAVLYMLAKYPTPNVTKFYDLTRRAAGNGKKA